MRQVLQFKITLLDIKPAIWRRIQISDLCTFWNLHVAIQDAMGWEDCHLHEFRVIDPTEQEQVRMGIPFDDDPEDYITLPGWDYKVRDYLELNPSMLYIYDFGDCWEHSIEFEGLVDKLPDTKYPRCLDGQRNCPPEDVGGYWRYDDFLKSLKDKKHPQHRVNRNWIGGSFDPEEFDADTIKFTNPSVRLNRLLNDQ
jgi:hypothetical protein